MIQFDASLTGVGVWYHTVSLTGGITPLVQPVGAGSVKIGWKLDSNSAYQNTCEFTGALLGLIGLLRHYVECGGVFPESVCFKGDSISALTWLDKLKHRGDNAFPAATLLTLICVKHGVQVRVTVVFDAWFWFLDSLS